MQTQSKPSPPIEFSGDIPALAHTLGMSVDEITASLDALIARGHLQRIAGSTWLLKPVR
jgi:hypothetical protein